MIVEKATVSQSHKWHTIPLVFDGIGHPCLDLFEIAHQDICEGTPQYQAYRALLQLFERLAVKEHEKTDS
jgi:hypothetical protein